MLSSRQVYANAWMTVREDAIRRDDGSPGIYGVVDKPTAAVVIPCDGDRFHLVEQFRYPVGQRRWEFPMGTAPDRAELDPAQLAARELQEETGLVAGRMELLGRLDIAPGMSSQREHVFLATDLTTGEAVREHTEQDMRASWFTTAELETMIREGTIVDAQTLAAYLLLKLRQMDGARGHRVDAEAGAVDGGHRADVHAAAAGGPQQHVVEPARQPHGLRGLAAWARAGVELGQ